MKKVDYTQYFKSLNTPFRGVCGCKVKFTVYNNSLNLLKVNFINKCNEKNCNITIHRSVPPILHKNYLEFLIDSKKIVLDTIEYMKEKEKVKNNA